MREAVIHHRNLCNISFEYTPVADCCQLRYWPYSIPWVRRCSVRDRRSRCRAADRPRCWGSPSQFITFRCNCPNCVLPLLLALRGLTILFWGSSKSFSAILRGNVMDDQDSCVFRWNRDKWHIGQYKRRGAIFVVRPQTATVPPRHGTCARAARAREWARRRCPWEDGMDDVIVISSLWFTKATLYLVRSDKWDCERFNERWLVIFVQ